jgi:UDP-N-acetylmuramate--alanine ligase
VVGAAGAGASAAAVLAQSAGAVVTACDAGGASPYTSAVEAAGITVVPRHDPAHVLIEPHPERLAVTKALTAIDPDNPELAAARSLAIPVEPWQQVIADAAVGRRLIAVAGTHGKSTTAGWLVHVLASAGRDPSAFVGALLPAADVGGRPSTARLGTGPEFVVEADEYAGNFDAYRPSVAVVTNIEWDHPDVFADRAAVIAAFEGWLRRAAETEADLTLIVNAGDDGAAELAARIAERPGSIVQYGFDGTAAGADFTATITGESSAGTSVEIRSTDRPVIPVTLPTAGRHNVENALAVAATALQLGIAPDAVARGLATFPGVGRRLERLGEARGVTVYDDYAHHPTAIRATLAAVRQREPGRTVWAVYEPLTYHRTAAMLQDFAAVLATADGVAIADIWAGRDPDTTVTSAAALAQAVAKRNPRIPTEAPGSVEATARHLATAVRSGDVVLVMGGGRSYQIGRLLLEELGR